MLHRRRLLCALLSRLGGKVNASTFHYHLFLLSQTQVAPSFEFVPTKDGCVSFLACSDIRWLIAHGSVAECGNFLETSRDIEPSSTELSDIDRYCMRYKDVDSVDLLRAIARIDPFIVSRVDDVDFLSAEEQSAVAHSRVPCSPPGLFSIGYEGRSIDGYLVTLLRHGIALLCDVRRNPLSRKYGFSKNELKRLLECIGIRYVHLPELGISSESRRGLMTREDYDRLFAEYDRVTLSSELSSLDTIVALVHEYGRVALTCFEADVRFCHRGRIALALEHRPDFDQSITHL